MTAHRLRAAAAALGVLAGLTLTPVVADAAAAAPVAAVAATFTATAEISTAPTAMRAAFAPAPRGLGDFPLRRRRRIHWNNWSHYVGGGRFSWLVFGPIIAVVLAALAVPLYLRRRLKRRRSNTSGAQPIVAAVPQTTTTVTADRLKRLQDLHASGALTDEEFVAQKRHIEGG